MSRPERILELYHLLAGRRLSIAEIARRFEVSPRTAYRDLELLERRHGAAIVAEEGRYRLMESATLRPLNLTHEEAVLLHIALHEGALAVRGAFARRLRSIEAKLAAAMRRPSAGESPLSLATVDRTGPAADAALTALEPAIAERRVCEAVYESLSGGDRRARRLHPLRLFQRADAWYLAAFTPEHDEVRVFRLDRFDQVEVLADRFAPPPGFDLETFLADAWELFRGEQALDVHLRFDPSLAPLILRARHHPGEQVSTGEDGTIDYRVRVTHLDELARWIVGFGGNVVVLGPEALRARVVDLARGVVEANAAEPRRHRGAKEWPGGSKGPRTGD